MRFELVCTGAELLDGRVTDTNTPMLAQMMRDAGWEISRLTVVSDGLEVIADALAEAMQREQVVVVSGGLGPTIDDLTRDAAARVLGVPLVEDEQALARLQYKFSQFGRKMSDNNRRQALFPQGATILPNAAGTADGFVCTPGDHLIVFAPGVPTEFEHMAREQIRPLLIARSGNAEAIATVSLKTFGQGESILDSQLAPLDLDGVRLAFTAVMPGVNITLTALEPDMATARAKLARARALVEEKIGESIYTDDRRTMEEVVAQALVERKLTVAVAESCTGGMVAARLTNVPGSSSWFREGVVTYSNEAKEARLGVSHATLEQHGAVSEQTAIEMAEGLRRGAGVDLALSITGIAGPTGGSKEKPVGTVFMALATPDGTKTWRNVLGYDRRSMRLIATETALDRLRRYLRGSYS